MIFIDIIMTGILTSSYFCSNSSAIKGQGFGAKQTLTAQIWSEQVIYFYDGMAFHSWRIHSYYLVSYLTHILAFIPPPPKLSYFTGIHG